MSYGECSSALTSTSGSTISVPIACRANAQLDRADDEPASFSALRCVCYPPFAQITPPHRLSLSPMHPQW
jgi:hypothetical protein